MNLFELVATLGLDSSKFEKGISSAKSNLQSTFSNIGNNVSKFGSNLNKIGSKITSIGTTASVVTAGVTAVLGASFNKAKSFIGTYESAMTVFTRKLEGGADSAGNLYDKLVTVAKGSAYAQEHMVSAGQTLVAMGLNADKTTKYIQAATDAISGFGGTGADVEEMARLFGKVSQQTNLYTQDIQQMVERGIPAWDILATKYSTTTDKVKEMARQGLIPATESLDTITDALEETDSASDMFKYSVAGLAKELKSGTLTGTLDSLNSSFRSFSLSLLNLDPRTESGKENIKKLNAVISEFGKTLENLGTKFSFVGEWVGNALEKIKEFLEILNNKLDNIPQEKLEKISKVILAIAAAGPVLLVTGKILSSLGTVFELLGSVVTDISGSFAALAGVCGGVGATLGIVAVAVGALVAVFIFLKENWDKVIEGFNQWVKNSGFNEKVEELKKRFEELGSKVAKLKDFFVAWGGALVAICVPAIATIMGIINGLMGAFNGIIKVLDGVIDFISGFGELIVGIFTGNNEKIQQGLNDMGNGILNFFIGLGETIWNYCSGYVTSIISIINIMSNAITTKITNVLNTVWNSVVNIFNSILNLTINIWNGIKNTIANAVNNVWSIVQNVFNNIKNFNTSIWNSIKNAIANAVNSARNTVQNVFNNIKNSVINTWNSVKSTTTSVWNSIKNAITQPVQNAYNSVKNLVYRMKGLFNFSWSLPKIKLPHLSVNGSFSLNPPSVPHFGVEWYKKGAILNKPTIFGVNPYTNNLMAGGEAGAEAILPIKVLKSYISEAMSEGFQEVNILYKNSANGKGTSAMVNGLVTTMSNTNQNINVYIGGKKIVSEIYNPLMNLMKNKEVIVGA